MKDVRISNRFILEIDLQSSRAVITLLVRMLREAVAEFPLGDILVLDCLLSTVEPPDLNQYGVREDGSGPTLSIQELALSLGQIALTLNCLDCGPRFQELSSLLEDPANRVDSSQTARRAVRVAQNFVSGDWVQTLLDRRLVDSPRRCPHRPEHEPNATGTKYESLPAKDENSADSASFLIGLLVLAGITIVLAAAISVTIRCVVFRRNRKWLDSLPDEQLEAVLQDQELQKAVENHINDTTTSMHRSPLIPVVVRWVIPFVLVVNIGFFVSGHISPGATVKAYIEIGGDEIRIDELYSISIAQSMIELWNAGAKGLAVSSSRVFTAARSLLTSKLLA
jgi:hypothetical protein